MKPTYSHRNALLLQLGYASYKDYLSSELWAEIRDAVLHRDKNSCNLCGSSARIVHHIDYSRATLLGNEFSGMVSLCHECHEEIEFTVDGKKRLLHEVVDLYYSIPGYKKPKRVLRKVCVECRINTPKKNTKMCRACMRKMQKHKCVNCGGSAKRNSVMCRPCLIVSKTA